MSQPPYEEIEHTADWALLVRGSSLGELFENAARGMLALLDPTFDQVPPEPGSLELSGLDVETLLVSWLEELLYQVEAHSVGFYDLNVLIDANSLRASFSMVPLISIEKQIKAVTYNELEIVSNDQGFETTIVFDV